jgi:hypothetical protein
MEGRPGGALWHLSGVLSVESNKKALQRSWRMIRGVIQDIFPDGAINLRRLLDSKLVQAMVLAQFNFGDNGSVRN